MRCINQHTSPVRTRQEGRKSFCVRWEVAAWPTGPYLAVIIEGLFDDGFGMPVDDARSEVSLEFVCRLLENFHAFLKFQKKDIAESTKFWERVPLAIHRRILGWALGFGAKIGVRYDK